MMYYLCIEGTDLSGCNSVLCAFLIIKKKSEGGGQN